MVVPLASGVLALVLYAVSSRAQDLGASCTGDMCQNGLACLSQAGIKCGNVTEDDLDDCRCGGIGPDDSPIFNGFSGQRFYFTAQAGGTYCLFSEQDHLVNAHFMPSGRIFKQNGISRVSGAAVPTTTSIDSIAYQHKNIQLLISANDNDLLQVRVNGLLLSLDLDYEEFYFDRWLSSDLRLRVQKHKAEDLHLTIETRLLQLALTPEPATVDMGGNVVRGYLDVQFSLMAEPDVAHGVLGQTAAEDKIWKDGLEIFQGEGEAEDYSVSTMFSTDFRFNQFIEPQDIWHRIWSTTFRSWQQSVLFCRKSLSDKLQEVFGETSAFGHASVGKLR